MRRLGWWIASGLAVLAAAGWALRSGPLAAATPVDAAVARRATLEVTLPVTGVYEVPAVDLSFDMPGRLARVLVEEGQAVRGGQVLAFLDDVELRAQASQAEAAAQAAAAQVGQAQAAVEAARAQVRQAEAAYRAAQAALARLQAGARSGELQQAQAAVDAARAALDQARRTLQSTEQLYAQGAVSTSQLDAARSQYTSAAAQYRQALAHLQTLQAGARPEDVTAASEQVRQAQAALDASRAALRQSEAALAAARLAARQARAAADAATARARRAALAAPFDGIVARVYLRPGALVGPGVPVVTVVAPAGWITAEVDEADIGRVSVGLRARITADAYPGLVLTGRVAAVGAQVEQRPGSRQVRVRIVLDGPVPLRAGTGVDVDLLLQTVPQALVVPVEAVVAAENDGSWVYVVDGGRLHRRLVRTGPRSDTLVAVEEGLSEGEVVALGDPRTLREGMRVRPRLVP
ncbi:MAG: efflux RND transporter periplasmic adaptor subunit [Armatimonadota bacterium]|nr:efflux RND transporter periplasmic adaptor subunit [Armatimonadota bacterium]MDR7438175.1 efflux RND transporter periplasmic adaptor subunit [Armatimonadota bacterium]MDR7472205.1 efflux RND transporter periplasmic adaptor subunit [Armatimonadota bacterium]MDR7507705.1 efflux RND transporter periplasmic adaptor subunit [Armatimonadota bacterium]MDR7510158.1 efflux RND transporter periplasmic adaptor subunit [Armatimonadota bacterium]